MMRSWRQLKISLTSQLTGHPNLLFYLYCAIRYAHLLSFEIELARKCNLLLF